jgi:hypothetical protein
MLLLVLSWRLWATFPYPQHWAVCRLSTACPRSRASPAYIVTPPKPPNTTLVRAATSVAEMAALLMSQAVNQRSKDDISIMVLEVHDLPGPVPAPAPASAAAAAAP